MTRGRGGPRSRAHLELRLACEQFVLLGPVERQIEFGQPRRGELDGLPALQARLNQLPAQEGEANETANVAPRNAVTLGQILEGSGAAVASSSNHARSRAIALIRAGSHLELRFCCANPGRTDLVSAPRRVKATAAVSSAALSLAASDADDRTSPPNSAPRRSLMMIVFSSTMIFSTSSRTSLARSPGEPLSAAAILVARPRSFGIRTLGKPARTRPPDQARRAGQRVGQDPDHGLLDLTGGEPPALRAIRSGLGDQGSGDVVAIAPPTVTWLYPSPSPSSPRSAPYLARASTRREGGTRISGRVRG
jgi:hypothetical protein